jgi:hypothetical protein
MDPTTPEHCRKVIDAGTSQCHAKPEIVIHHIIQIVLDISAGGEPNPSRKEDLRLEEVICFLPGAYESKNIKSVKRRISPNDN